MRFPERVTEDILDWLLGEHIGGGYSREVYAYGPHPDYVVKVAQGGDYLFQNIAEWSLWGAATKGLRRWLAPCEALSPNGHLLLQRRCEPCPTHLIPKKAPACLTDLHEGNWGILDGKPVVMDYGLNLVHHLAANAKAMQEVKRWMEE